MTYSDGTTVLYGSPGYRDNPPSDPTQVLTLSPGEIVTSMFGSSGAILDSIGFTTSQGRSTGYWGNSIGGELFSTPGHVVGFYGATSLGVLAAVGVYTLQSARVKYSMVMGTPLGDGVIPWDDGNGYEGLNFFLLAKLLHDLLCIGLWRSTAGLKLVSCVAGLSCSIVVIKRVVCSYEQAEGRGCMGGSVGGSILKWILCNSCC